MAALKDPLLLAEESQHVESPNTGAEFTGCTTSEPIVSDNGRAADDEHLENGGISPEDGFELWKELRQQCWLAGPMISVNLLQFLIQTTSVMFAGHLGELSLSGASLATSFCIVSGFSVLMGMASALETLCGQAYGAGQYRMLGIYLQRAVVVLNITTLPIAVIWLNMEQILRALGQDRAISMMAGEYARWLIPGVFAYATLQPLMKFLQTQSAVFPMMMCSVSTILMHIPLCWLLVYKLGIGARGAALSASISNWLNVILLTTYVKFSVRCKETWTTFSREAFHGLKGFFGLAVPSALMICLEYWSFEALVLLSGTLPNPQLETSAFSILVNTLNVCYMIPYGISAAISTRVSNELGAGHPLAARSAVCVTLGIAIADSVLIATTLFSTRNILGWVFSNEEEVVKYVASLLPLTACVTIVDPIQGVLSGVARGCGWQGLGAFANLGAYYVVGLPIGCLLAFVFQLKGRGLWMGIVCGIATQTILLAIATIRTDWQKEAREAWKRAHLTLPEVMPETNEQVKLLP